MVERHELTRLGVRRRDDATLATRRARGEARNRSFSIDERRSRRLTSSSRCERAKMSNDPRAWRDVEPTTVGVAARALAERRRARERAVNDGGAGVSRGRSARARGGAGTLEDPLGFGDVDARASVERAVELVETSTSFGIRGKDADEDVRAYRRRVRDALTVSSASFDGKLFLAAAHGERSANELRDALRRMEAMGTSDARARKEFVAEHLPTLLACLDAMEDARNLLRKGREEHGEFGVTAELESRLSRAAKSARESLREVFELEERREKILRVLKTFERHEDVFGIPGAIREALARGDYVDAANRCSRAHLSFAGQNSKVLNAILAEIEGDVANAVERLFERLYVGELDDVEAEMTVSALQTLKSCRRSTSNDVDSGDATKIYFDRLVHHACECLTTSASAEDVDVDALSREYRASFVRVWRFATLTDSVNTSHARDALDKIQSLYIDVIKVQFETAVNGRVDAKARRHYDALMDKCAKMSRVGFALSNTYDVLRTRLEIQADFLGGLQQQCTRYSVSLRVHLEQALKSASKPPSDADADESATSAFFAEDARAVFECASHYWYNDSFTTWMKRAGARDFDALVDSFYGIVCALVEHRLTVCGDALFAMRSVLHLDAEFRAFCDARLGATDGRPKRVSLENELVKSARTLQATFIDEKLATLVVDVRAWLFASSADVDVSDECVHVIHRCRDIFDATDVISLDISRVITHRVIDVTRDEFTKALARVRPVAGRLRLEFEFVKLALDSRLTQIARDGADRLIELATRLRPDDDPLLRARRLQACLRRSAELLRRLET